MPDYILALDQGTTSSRAIVFDRHGSLVSVAQQEFQQIYPCGRTGCLTEKLCGLTVGQPVCVGTFEPAVHQLAA